MGLPDGHISMHTPTLTISQLLELPGQYSEVISAPIFTVTTHQCSPSENSRIDVINVKLTLVNHPAFWLLGRYSDVLGASNDFKVVHFVLHEFVHSPLFIPL